MIVCHPSPLQSAYHLAKTEVLSEQLQTLGLLLDKVSFVYVGEGDRREAVVSCVPPFLYTRIVSSLLLSCAISSAPSISPPSLSLSVDVNIIPQVA